MSTVKKRKDTVFSFSTTPLWLSVEGFGGKRLKMGLKRSGLRGLKV